MYTWLERAVDIHLGGNCKVIIGQPAPRPDRWYATVIAISIGVEAVLASARASAANRVSG